MYEGDKTGIEENIDKTNTNVQRENCAGDDAVKTLLADNQGTMTVEERLVMATAWNRQCFKVTSSQCAVTPHKE